MFLYCYNNWAKGRCRPQSLFLAEEVQVRPFLVGLFYTVNTR